MLAADWRMRAEEKRVMNDSFPDHVLPVADVVPRAGVWNGAELEWQNLPGGGVRADRLWPLLKSCRRVEPHILIDSDATRYLQISLQSMTWFRPACFLAEAVVMRDGAIHRIR
jgi:hypothetical protein